MKMKIPNSGSGNGYYGHESGVIAYLDNDEPEVDIQPVSDSDFSEYMWMENEEEFDKEVLEQLEEEELMEECLEAMLEEERQHQRNQTSTAWCNATNGLDSSGNELCQQLGSLRVQGDLAKQSTLNPDAAEFVPSFKTSVTPFLQPSRRCGVIITAALTGNEVQELLHVHNQYNQIPQIKWDQELAASAQTWADQCVLRADACRNTERAIVAQSWSYTRTAGPIRTPLSELVNLNRVPKGTTIMGCGAIRYNPDGKWNTAYLVCNYARPVY